MSGGVALGCAEELKNGGRHAFKAEVHSLALLTGCLASSAGSVPRLLGVSQTSRGVLMTWFCGAALPDTDYAPVLSRSLSDLIFMLECWMDVAEAVAEAGRVDLVHCDVLWCSLVEPTPCGPRRSPRQHFSPPRKNCHDFGMAGRGALRAPLSARGKSWQLLHGGENCCHGERLGTQASGEGSGARPLGYTGCRFN